MPQIPYSKFFVGAAIWLNPCHMPKPLVIRGRKMKLSLIFTTIVRSSTPHDNTQIEEYSKTRKKAELRAIKINKLKGPWSSSTLSHLCLRFQLLLNDYWICVTIWKPIPGLQILIFKCWWIFILIYFHTSQKLNMIYTYHCSLIPPHSPPKKTVPHFFTQEKIQIFS